MFTSLKALKWVYELGVKQERTRIARELENVMAQNHNSRELAYNMSLDPKLSKDRKRRLEFRGAVFKEVLDIVNTIMRPQDLEQNPTSIMFPEGEK